MSVAPLLSKDAAASFAGRRILFTGGSGFVGSHMVRQAIAAGAEPHVIGRRPGPEGCIFHIADLTDRAQVAAIVRMVEPAAVVHLAAPGVAYGGTGFAEMLSVVVRSTEAVLAACAELTNPPAVVQVGSGFEYATADTAVDEDHPLIPSGSLYGAAKAVGATVAGGFADALPIMLMRPFHIYGPGEAAGRLGVWLIRKALAGEPAEVTALEQRRDALHVDDAGAALWAAAAHVGDRHGLTMLNLGSGNPISLRRFVEELIASLAAVGHVADVRIGALPYRIGEPMVSLPDLTRLHATLAWRPRIGLREGLDDLVRWSLATWA